MSAAAEPRSLIAIGAATRMLAEAKSMEDVRQIRDLAEAARVYARAHLLGIEAENSAAEIKLRAERKGGELIPELRTRGELATRGGDRRSIRQESELIPTLAAVGLSYEQAERMQAVAAIPEPTFEAAIAEAKETGERLTTSGVLRLAPLMSSESAEWYTPAPVVERVVAALGAIDLDPCAEPARAVPAATHYTAEDDGLEYGWFGRVYMNPPYGRAIAPWIEKLANEFEMGNVEQAVALLPARTDTRWWERLPAASICLLRGRLKFSGHENSAPFPSVAAYLGPDGAAFEAAFAELGLLYRRVSA